MILSSKYQLLWYKAVHLTVVKQLKDKQKKLKDKDAVKSNFLSWRIAFNLYRSGDYVNALAKLEELFKMEEEQSSKEMIANTTSEKRKALVLTNNSLIHQIAGRCAVQLFLSSGHHYHLESAYNHYENSINTMSANLFTMFKLPPLLLEFGLVLEYYGSFESALDIYARVITNFPNFRGYFDALYRTGIITRHLAELMPLSDEKEEAINRCIDIFQFLLEALPTNISDVHCILVYGRTLEMSSNAQLKYRSTTVYVTLFETCRKHNIANARDFTSVKTWSEATINWFDLGEEITKSGEFLIAKDAYNKFIDEKEKFAKYGIKPQLSVDICLTLAKRFAFYQNMSQAIRFAEMGVSIDRYHKETRRLLAQWSKSHGSEFTRERDAIQNIVSTWRGRCWTGGFVRRLKTSVITESEENLAKNSRDMAARKSLAYYAKEKWRAKFLYEEHCAVVIQRFFREIKKVWVWQEIQYKQYEGKATDLTRKFRRTPMDRDIREEIKILSQHRLCPKKNHPIVDIIQRVFTEERAVWQIKRSITSYAIRSRLAARVKIRVDIKNKVLNEASTVIQSIVRMKISHYKVEEMIAWKTRRYYAAVCIQSFYRWRIRTFKHNVGLAVDDNKQKIMTRNRALRTLKYLLPGKVKAYFIRKDQRVRMATRRSSMIAAAETSRRVQAQRLKSCIQLQTFFRTVFANFMTKLSTTVISMRKQVHLSMGSSLLLHDVHKNIESCAYRPPGVRSSSPAFAILMKQNTVYCKEHFSPADCLMLSIVLKHEYCNIKSLIFSHIIDSKNPCYEFDLLPAIHQNKSLRSLTVVGGTFSVGFISGLIFCIQVENPRIVNLTIEKQPAPLGDSIGSHTGRLLLDYFNYSIPGIVSISLHGCSLRDSQIGMIADGMVVNSSITDLCLSLNIISDVGFSAIFAAICKNKKSRLKRLDFSYNLIRGTKQTVDALEGYQHADLKSYLTVYLINNIIYKRYFSSDHAFNVNRTHLKIIYQYDDLETNSLRAHFVNYLKLQSYDPHSDRQQYGNVTKNNVFFKSAGKSIMNENDYLLKKRNATQQKIKHSLSSHSLDTSRSSYSDSTATFSVSTFRNQRY